MYYRGVTWVLCLELWFGKCLEDLWVGVKDVAWTVLGFSRWILLVLGNFVICGQLWVSVWVTYNFKAVFTLPFMLVHLLTGGTAFFLCCLCRSWVLILRCLDA